MSPLPTDPTRQRGFALLTVIVLLTILSIIAGSVALMSERAVEDVSTRAEAWEDEKDAFSTRETLIYLLATQRMTIRGLTVDDRVRLADGQLRPMQPEDIDEGLSVLPIGNEIRLDGTPYQGLGRIVFSLQDGRGLLSPNWSPPPLREALVQSLGSPSSSWRALESKRLDFQDADDLVRADGAEAHDYLRRGLPEPANRPLLTPLELRNVAGWRDTVSVLDDETIADRMVVTWDVYVNINTAPAANLALIPGLSPRAAERAVALRDVSPWTTTWAFADTFGVSRQDIRDLLLLAPNGTGTMSLWSSRGGPRQTHHWTLTGADEGGYPWRIDYDLVLPPANGRPAARPRPAPSNLLASPVPDR